jgi:hypothetical protein
MASLLASPAVSGAGQLRQARPQRAAVSHAVSSLRVRPFQAARQQVRMQSAAAEGAAVEELDFDFNLSDARKNNEYSASDVDAAMRFFEGDGGAEPVINKDFPVNEMGLEDASFFDDIDNNEAYDADEYIVAGIPEAAPKRRGRGRRDAGADEEDDLSREAKELERMKEVEDAAILAAAMEDEFGGYDGSQQGEVRVDSPGLWDWLTDEAADNDVVDELASAKLFSVKHSSVELPSDSDVMAGLGAANQWEDLEPETRDLLQLVVGEGDLTDEEMRMIDGQEEELPQLVAPSEADVNRMEMLAAEAVLELAVEEAAMPAGIKVGGRAGGRAG